MPESTFNRSSILYLVLLAFLFVTQSSCGGSQIDSTSEPQQCSPTLFRLAEYDPNIDNEARFAEQQCDLPREISGSVSGRPDENNCGPFPCMTNGCLVEQCTPDRYCSSGFCNNGLCVVALEHGDRQCDSFNRDVLTQIVTIEIPTEVSEYLTTRSACQCTPDSPIRARDPMACGPFPCSPNGCYIQPCQRDDDCDFGLCGHYGGAVYGHCVTDDPH